MAEMVRSFKDLTADQRPLAGGKGGTLARLYQAGHPVPDGFIVLPAAFDGDLLRAEAWQQVGERLGSLRGADPNMAFAVRSSAMSEDAAAASFAGEFETVLDVHTDEMIRDAIHTVRRSRRSERVRAYSQAKGMDQDHEIAVVVQRLVRADISGVLFTADPVSGSRMQMMGNYVYGLGDELVSGEVEPYTFTLARPKGRYTGPPDLRRHAARLFKLGRRLERDEGCPQDIEWAIAGGRLYLLQSRPITTLIGHDPDTGEWNATLTGDYLWTNLFMGEVFPEPTTPSSWSVWNTWFDQLSFGDVPTIGNIAGRPYLNYSLTYSLMFSLMRKRERVMAMIGDSVGAPPDGVDIPAFPVSMKTFVFRVIPREFKNELKKATLTRDAPGFLQVVQTRCRQIRHQIQGIERRDALLRTWSEGIFPLWEDLRLLQDKTNETLQGGTRKLKQELTRLVGEAQANTLLATASGSGGELASLGPLAGLNKLQSGEMGRGEYLERYGHRGPNENELAEPRPYEDPGWVDRQLAALGQSPVDVAALLEKRRAAFETVWQEVAHRIPPKKVRAIAQRIDDMAAANNAREAVRSELTRMVGVIRTFFTRAGEFIGLGDDVFFLTLDEVLDALSGKEPATACIPARRKTHETYLALPPLPAWIRGRFDPFQWAADPNRRTDVHDAQLRPISTTDDGNMIQGHPGSAGHVEGIVHRIDSPEEGDQLQPGEVLVTGTTNVGWTPLFPRAAAIVTDIGGSLSHAAIVARELGIPAVVGCVDATMRLHTGDRVSIDGGQGIVRLLAAAQDA